MFIKRLGGFAVILVVLLAGVDSFIPSLADAGPLPYVYYYAWDRKAWIIERTDGTDGFLIKTGSDCTDLSWSPSGNWMLTYCANSQGNGSHWVAVPLGNQKPVTILTESAPFASGKLEWSPTGEDLLMITRFYVEDPYSEPPNEEFQQVVYVIDLSRDRLVLQKNVEQLHNCAAWSPDGRYIAVYTAYGVYTEEPPPSLIMPVNPKTAGSTPDVVERKNFTPDMWTSDSRIVDPPYTDNKLIIDDLSKHTQLSLPFTSWEEISGPTWSADRRHSLIYADNTLWLFTPADNTLKKVADNAVLPTDENMQISEYRTTSFDPPGWTPDGSRALFATQDGKLHWLDTGGSVTDVSGMPPREGKGQAVPMVQWGGPYVFIQWNKNAYVYNMDSGQMMTALAKQEPFLYLEYSPNFKASPDGRSLAVIGSCSKVPGGACIWDWATQKGVRVMPNPVIAEEYSPVSGTIEWFPTGNALVVNEVVPTPGSGITVGAVASADGAAYRVFDGHARPLPPQADVARIPHGDAFSRNEMVIPAHDSTVGLVTWSPDGRWLASVPTDFVGSFEYVMRGGDEARVWDAVSGQKVGELPLTLCTWISVDAPPGKDGLYLAKASKNDEYSGYITGMDWPRLKGETKLAVVLSECNKRYRLLIWDWAAAKITAEYEGVTAVAFAPGGGTVALGYTDGKVVLTAYPDINAAEVLTTLPTLVDALAFNVDGSRLVIASANIEKTAGSLTAFNLTTRKPYFTIARPEFRMLALSPDGTKIALAQRNAPYSGSEQNKPTMLDGTTGKAIGDPKTTLYAAAFSPDGRALATGGGGTSVMDATTYAPIMFCNPNGRSLAWSPDGKRLAIAASFGIFVRTLP